MSLPEVWLSAPSVRLPALVRDNEQVLGLVREQFLGSDAQWAKVESRLRSLWRACGTDKRHFEPEPFPVAGHAAAAAGDALARAGIAATDVDLFLYGSLAREYFEPATASEVALRLHAPHSMALDVTAACAGSLLAIQDFVARAAVDDAIRTGVVCTSTVWAPGYIQYGIQTPAEVTSLGAGLTLGNAASGMVLTRDQRPGSGRIRAMYAEAMNEHHPLCRAPVNGHFFSDGPALFGLARHLPGHVKKLCARAGWELSEVDLFVCHQPSNSVLRALAAATETPPERVPQLHAIYGNCAESAVPLTLRHVLDHGMVKPGAKLVLAAAASGFVMASLAVEWGDAVTTSGR